jgi:hypothetical protein
MPESFPLTMKTILSLDMKVFHQGYDEQNTLLGIVVTDGAWG